MQISEHLEALRREGALLADAAAAVPADRPVPSCQGWSVRDLVRHTGMVHRWATSYVTGALTEARGDDDDPDVGPVPDDDALVPWFRAGHAGLLDALGAAPADLRCWTFLRAPSPLAFWARRQAHETAVHRADADLAAGRAPAVDATLAADGIDELICGFFARPGRALRSDPPRTLAIRTDHGHAWWIRMTPDGRTVGRGPAEADCALSGPASDVYLALWNRLPTDDLTVQGDAGVLALWRDQAKIRWS